MFKIDRLKKLVVEHKKVLFLLVAGVVVGCILIILLIRPDRVDITPPVVSNIPMPPVNVVAPELKLIEVNPEEGVRETVDSLSQTFFRFSSAINNSTAEVTVVPQTKIITNVYTANPDTLVVEPIVPWVSGTSYTITIDRIQGVNGEELKGSINYRFSVNLITEVWGGDPIR